MTITFDNLSSDLYQKLFPKLESISGYALIRSTALTSNIAPPLSRGFAPYDEKYEVTVEVPNTLQDNDRQCFDVLLGLFSEYSILEVEKERENAFRQIRQADAKVEYFYNLGFWSRLKYLFIGFKGGQNESTI